MIYDDRIQIPVLCPIYFGNGRFSHFYNSEQEYVGKIISSTSVFFWCSAGFYADMHDGEDKCFLQVVDEDNKVLYSYPIERGVIQGKEEVDIYFYGKVDIPYYTDQTFCARFKIVLNNEVVADSWLYEINPYYDKDIKVIEYSHFENDYDMLFFKAIEQTVFNVVGGIAISPTEIDASNSPFLQYLSVGDALLKIGDNDVSSYGATIESIEDGVIRFSDEYFNNQLDQLYWTGYILQFETQETQHIPITYKISLECGFNPDDFETRDENTDFVGQDMFNEIVDARPHTIEPLTIGDNGGIPNWLAHKINVISILSSLKIDGEEFVRVQGSKFETIEKTKGMGVYKVELQTKNENYIPFKIFDNTFAYEFN